MAQIRIPCLVERTNQAGVTSYYWQPSATLKAAGWKPVALGKIRAAAIAAAEARNREVADWKAGGPKPGEIRKRVQTGTVSALIARYRREVVYGAKASGAPRIREKTRSVYETSLKRLEAWAGKHPVAFITPARVRALRDAVAKPIDQGGLGHASAFNLLRQLRQLMAFAESIDVIPKGSNPATEFRLEKPPSRRAIWSAEDEAAFIAAAYELGLPSMALAIELAIYTAQREGDLIAFTEPQYQELEISDPVLRAILAGDDGKVMGWRFDQGKTSDEYAAREMEIPIEPRLRPKIEAALRANRARDRAADPPRLISHLLVDDRTGLPWKQRAFIDCWRGILEHAATRTGREGMRKLVWHDLRRTRVVRLRRRNMPAEQIAAITGHDPRSVLEILKVYGPIDRHITAAAIAGTIEPKEPKKAKARTKKESNTG